MLCVIQWWQVEFNLICVNLNAIRLQWLRCSHSNTRILTTMKCFVGALRLWALGHLSNVIRMLNDGKVCGIGDDVDVGN